MSETGRPPAGVHAHTAAWAADVLRERISAGELRPGAKLPEEALAAELGVSRHTLRVAFATLAAESIAVRVPNRGVFAARPDTETVRADYRTRRILEPAAVLWCEVTPAAAAELERIAHDAARALASGQERAMADANQRVHRTVVALTGSPALTETMDRVVARMRLLFAQMVDVRSFHATYVPRNLELVELLRTGRREQAARFLRTYLDDAEAELLEHLARR